VPVRGRRPLGSPDARRAVLDAARELFAELGFERTTMRAVAARAGVDPALIYHYFGDKDGLLFAALQPPADAATVFAGLAAAGAPVMLAGRAIRVANADPAELAEVLRAAGIEASLQPVPATIEERMLVLSRQAKAS